MNQNFVYKVFDMEKNGIVVGTAQTRFDARDIVINYLMKELSPDEWQEYAEQCNYESVDDFQDAVWMDDEYDNIFEILVARCPITC